MKNSLPLLCFVFLLLTGCNRRTHTHVPDVVSRKFSILFPDAADVSWDKEDSLFEASFRQDTLNKSITLDEKGTVQWMETPISPLQLPPTIRDYLIKHTGNKEITEASMIIYPDGNFTYEAEIDGRDYLFDGAGQFLTMETEADNREE